MLDENALMLAKLGISTVFYYPYYSRKTVNVCSFPILFYVVRSVDVARVQ